MNTRTLLVHALEGAWRTRRYRDVQASAATVALLSLVCVAGLGLAEGVSEAIAHEHQRMRLKYGTLQISDTGESDVGLLGHRERILALGEEPERSGIEAVSTVYESPLEKHLGLLPATPDGEPDEEDQGSIAVADDDPFVLPGFGLPAHAPKAFERDADEQCWRFAYVASRNAIARALGVDDPHADVVDRVVEAPPGSTQIAFKTTIPIRDLDGKPHHARPMKTKPEFVLDLSGDDVAPYITNLDAPLAIASNGQGRYLPALALRQFHIGMKGECAGAEPSEPMLRATVGRNERNLDVREVRALPKGDAPFDTLPIEIDSEDRGFRELGARTVDGRAGVPIKRYVLWVHEPDTLEALERAEANTRTALRDLPGLAVGVIDRTERDQNLRARELNTAGARIGAVAAAMILIGVTFSLGLSHTHRQRHEIALLRSQGASKRAVMTISTVEVMALVVTASAAGCALGIALLESGMAHALANALGMPGARDASVTIGASPTSGAATMIGFGTCAMIGALGTAAKAAQRDPGAQLQLR